MKTIILIMLAVFTAGISQAQRFHLNALGGLSSYGGDLQSKSFSLKQSRGAAAFGASYELSKKWYVRSEYTFTNLSADDAYANTPGQVQRNLNFKTIIQELSLTAEYNFLDIYEHQLVPYIFGGIGIFRFNPYTYDSLGTKYFLQALHTEGQGLVQYPGRKLYHVTQLNIPVGAGVKFALSDNIRVGMEFGFRKLFTDYLDDVSTTYPAPRYLTGRGRAFSYRGDELKPAIPFPGEGAQRGNDRVKDNYYFLMFRVSYRLPFGKNINDVHSGRNYNNCPPVGL